MKKIIRVFPKKTKHTPDDPFAFIGDPPLFVPKVDEVHISCVFTWDIEKCQRLSMAWSQYFKKVKLGGPAFGSLADEFTPGMYVKEGIVYTSRGCLNSCPWCVVSEREGPIHELKIHPGRILQDNNVLQCNRNHIEQVFEMLKTQKQVILSGGIQADLITDRIVDNLKSISLRRIFTACDYKEAIPAIKRAGMLLKDLTTDQKRCYAMIGYDGETISEAEERLEAIWNAGFVPFAQLYQPFKIKEKKIVYSLEWRDLQSVWCRPASTIAIHKKKIPNDTNETLL